MAQQHQLEVLAGPLFVFGQVLAQLGGLLVDVFEDAVEAAVLVDQLGGGLLPHPGHAGQVVAVVAAQRGVLHVQRRRHPGSFLDAGLVVERVVADAALVVEHLDVGVAHELVAVAVAGDDDHLVAGVDELVGGRGDQVVGLPAGQVDRCDADGVEHLADEPHLLAQDVGGGFSLRLVQRFGLVAECGLGTVEGHQRRRRACGP